MPEFKEGGKNFVAKRFDRYNKSPEKWNAVMSEKGDQLAPFTDDLLMQIEGADEGVWEEGYQQIQKATHGFKLSMAPMIAGRTFAEEAFPALHSFEKQFPQALLEGGAHLHTVHVQPKMRLPLLGAGQLLSQIFFGVYRVLERPQPQFKKEARMDLSSGMAVMKDNVQTMLDVGSLVARFVKTPKELTTVMSRLLQICPNDEVTVHEKNIKVNPRNYTYLELFSLAPFSFWGTSIRVRQPDTYEGLPIVRPNDEERPIDPHFIYMITREAVPVSAGVSDKTSRHGGCPALHPAFRELDLINRLGKLFVRSQEECMRRHEGGS